MQGACYSVDTCSELWQTYPSHYHTAHVSGLSWTRQQHGSKHATTSITKHPQTLSCGGVHACFRTHKLPVSTLLLCLSRHAQMLWRPHNTAMSSDSAHKHRQQPINHAGTELLTVGCTATRRSCAVLAMLAPKGLLACSAPGTTLQQCVEPKRFAV